MYAIFQLTSFTAKYLHTICVFAGFPGSRMQASG